jgi:phosphatidylserine/phosphatidylglycerophosphate/cardiolipin synthase-like enzyme
MASSSDAPSGSQRVAPLLEADSPHLRGEDESWMADDRVLSIGSANANPRGFLLDTELSVTMDDAEAAVSFRHRLWAHDLGVAQTTVSGWDPSELIARWDAVAAANDRQRSSPDRMTGEAVIPFDPLKEKGARQKDIHDVETELARPVRE